MSGSDSAQALQELHGESFAWAVFCTQGDRDLAEEVLQGTYLRVLEGRLVFSGRSTFKTWLFAVIRRAVRDSRRRNQWRRALLGRWRPSHEVAVSDRSERERPDGRFAKRERSRLVRSLMATLSPRQQQVLELTFYHELALDEAAEILGVSRGSASQHYDRGKRALSRLLIAEGILDGHE